MNCCRKRQQQALGISVSTGGGGRGGFSAGRGTGFGPAGVQVGPTSFAIGPQFPSSFYQSTYSYPQAQGGCPYGYTPQAGADGQLWCWPPTW